MRLAISNIAWDVSEDNDVARLLKDFSIDAIDVAPGKYFSRPGNASDQDIEKVKYWWADHGIEITGMQSLLFGTNGLNLFGERQVQDAMLEHLAAICRIGGILGAPRLVFGSPKNRDRTGLNDSQALDQAVNFFGRLGDIARSAGVVICLEPNPKRYGANFMTSSSETAQVVEAVNHCAIKMQFDSGALAINNESPEDVVQNNAKLIGHIHASEPGLSPLGDSDVNHHIFHRALVKHLSEHVVSIEMVATTDEPHLASIERALSCAVNCYQPPQEAI